MKKQLTLMFTFAFLAFYNLLPVYAHDFAWAKSMGGQWADNGFNTTTDAAGNVYVVGDFQDTVDFDPGPGVFNLVCKGMVDAFVAKYTPAGDLVWAKAWGSTYTDRARDIFVDDFQNVYICGDFWDTVDFDPGPGVFDLIGRGLTDAYITKLDSAGNFIWAKSFGGKGNDGIAWSIAVDALGNIYTSGTFRDTVDFDPGPGVYNLVSYAGTAFTSGMAVFISKLDSAGNFVWAKKVIGTMGYLALDTFANVYITGGYGATNNDFDPGPGVHNLSSNGGSDIYILKLDSAGNFIWAKSMGGSKADHGRAITVDVWGNVYTTGWFNEAVDFDPGVDSFILISAGGVDIFISKLDSAGNFLWAKGVGGGGGDFSYNITLDAVGNVYYTGRFQSSVDFDPGPGTFFLNTVFGGQAYEIFISKLDSSGKFIWAKQIEQQEIRQGHAGYGISIDISGNIYATGSFSIKADFDPGTDTFSLSSNGTLNDIYLLKLLCSDTSSSFFTVLECGTNGYTLNGEHYIQSGIYTQKFPNTAGCDSTVTLHLTIDPLPTPVIRVDNFTLITGETYTTYQWFLNGNPIPGANSNSFTVTQNGDYKVVVTNENGCSDTSDIYPITNVDIDDVYKAEQVQLFPNPANNEVYFRSAISIQVTLTSIEGKILQRINNPASLFLKSLPDGIYLLHIANEEGNIFKVEKLVKQNR